MIVAIDTNILLDLLIPNQKYLDSSLKSLRKASQKGETIISEIVFTELASQFRNLTSLTKFLHDTHIGIVQNNEVSLFLASRLWLDYINRKKAETYCPECGKPIKITCPQCSCQLNMPRRVLNDFIIGAHSITFSDALLSRDRGFYRVYFRDLQLFE